MNQKSQNALAGLLGVPNVPISRRVAAGSSVLAFLHLLTRSAFGQSREQALKEAQERAQAAAQAQRDGAAEDSFRRMQERMDPEQRAFFEQMWNADTADERIKVSQDWQLRQLLERLKRELGVSQEEWSVLQPRIVAVYRLVHMQPSSGKEDTEGLALVAQRMKELRELLDNKEAKPGEIKAKLTALRAARERGVQDLVKARQNLRRLLTLRQEAVLILHGLLD
jgi:plasmid maintenance system antidote protein VapI